MKQKVSIPKYPPYWIARLTEKLRIFLIKISGRMVPARFAVVELAQNFFLSKAISVAAELKIADCLLDGPKTVSLIAKETGTDPGSLYRLMRALASFRVFKELKNKTFVLTPMAKALTDCDESMKYLVMHMTSPCNWEMFGQMIHTIKTGKNAAKKLYGMEIFEYLKTNSYERNLFNKAMSNTSDMVSGAVISSYSFKGTKKLIDVGGGHGFLLSIILSKNKKMKGIVFDSSHVVEGARENFEKFGVSNRAGIKAGDFFESVPEGGDTYILKSILHDWNDEDCIKILKNINNVISNNGKLILVDSVIREDNEPAFGKLIDILMLIGTDGGKERTKKEFEYIFEQSGFKLTKITHTVAPLSLIEGIKV